jgi:UDPglucose 6-dehydrogenase
MPTLEGAIASNKQTIARIIDQVVTGLGGSLANRKIAVWGISYKANVGDIRGSTALEIANSLQSLGATVEAFDPLVGQDKVPGIRLTSSPIDVCFGASALVVLTEWDVFQKVKRSHKVNRLIRERQLFENNITLNSVNPWQALGRARM